VPGHPRAFVVGDAARVDGKNGQPLPGVSPVAMQQARAVARSIRRAIVGKDTVPFVYLDKGSMATIGRSRAVAVMEPMRLTGFVAWLAWLLVHIWYLIGFKNRLVVMVIWAWSYVTYRRGARLITGLPCAPDTGRPDGS
jgi:NADH dehydrogenase